MFNWQTFGPKLHKVGAYLTGVSGSGVFAMSGDTHTWQYAVASALLFVGCAFIAIGDIISMFASDDTPTFQVPPRAPMLLLALLALSALLCLSGCQKDDAIAEANADTEKAVTALATTVQGTADFIAETWANHETALAKRRYAAVRAENSVMAMPVTTPSSTAAATVLNPAPVRVLPEPAAMALQAQYDADIAQIAIGKQQICQAVINQYTGNLAAAQALLQGQANYYATAGANNSTLQTGLDSALSVFKQFAPVLATAIAPKPKAAPATTKTKVAGVKIGTVGIGVTTTSK